MIGLLQKSIEVYETALRETNKIQGFGRLLQQLLFFQYVFTLTEQKMSHHRTILKSQNPEEVD